MTSRFFSDLGFRTMWRGVIQAAFLFNLMASTTANAVVAAPQSHYVSLTGSNSNKGISSSPWRTLAYACSHVSHAGDTIVLGAGTFEETAQCLLASGVNIKGAGNTGSSITTLVYAPGVSTNFSWMPNSAAIFLQPLSQGNTLSGFVLDGNNWTNDIGIGTARYPYAAWNDASVNSTNITIHNVNFTHWNWVALWITEVTGGSIYSCNFVESGNQNNGAVLGMLSIGGASGLQIYSLNFSHDSSYTGTGIDSHQGYGIKFWDRPSVNLTLHDITIALEPITAWAGMNTPNLGIEFAHVRAQNIQVYNLTSNATLSVVLDSPTSDNHVGPPYEGPGDAVRIYNSTLTVQPTVGYAVELAGSYARVDHSVIDGRKGSVGWTTDPGVYQFFADYGNGSFTNTRIDHNLLLGLLDNVYGPSTAFQNLTIANNTIVLAKTSNQSFTLFNTNVNADSNLMFANNVIYSATPRTTSSYWMQVNGGNMTSLTGYIEKNYYYNLTLPTTAPAGLSLIGNLSVSPKFTGGSGTLQSIYTPASGSPLLNGGIVIPGITDGYTGSAPNIGAY